MFLKCGSQEDENEFRRTERGFFSKQNDLQKPLSVFKNMFLLEIYG
jgi:hypothetical protein